jgi:hypothetical protein
MSAQIDQAQCFITALAGHKPVTFQTFDDSPAKRPLAHILHGTLSQHQVYLEALNTKGAGIFLTINEGKGTGRSNAGIIRIRAVFVDTDGAPYPVNLPLRPHIIVQSSPGRWHLYWLVDGVLLGDFGVIQAALAEKYGTDPTITDLCRVMRIPGFNHCKAEPVRVELLETLDAAPYTAAQIFAVWPEIAERVEREQVEAEQRKQEAAQRRAEAEQRRKDDNTRTLDEKRAQGILRAICDRIARTTDNRNNALLRAARTMGGYIASEYLAEDEVTEALELAARECGLQDQEVGGCISRGISYGLDRPLYLTNDDTGKYDATANRMTIRSTKKKPKSYRSRVYARMRGWGNGRA